MEDGDRYRRISQHTAKRQKIDGKFVYYSELRTTPNKPIIIFEPMFVYASESRKGQGSMSENERALILKIRQSKNPERMMDYIEELLFNPQKFQEEFKALSAPQET